MLHNFNVNFVSIEKIERYSSQFIDHGSQLKRYCVMYIGQKKNFWVVDLERSAQGRGTREQGVVDSVVKVHVDQLKEYVEKLGSEWFVDEMVAEGKEMMDTVFGEK
jgi:hypothetical protein